MPNANEYLRKIGEIVGDDLSDGVININFLWNNREEGKQVLAKIRQMQGELKFLKKEVAFEISEIKSHFTTQRNAVGKGFMSGVAGALFGKRSVGKMNASEKDSLRRSQQKAVVPLEEVKNIIDRVLHKLDGLKFNVEQSEEYKILPNPPARSSPPPPPPHPVQTSKTEVLKYEVKINGETKGPYTREQLQALLSAGAIQEDSRCRYHGTKEWRPYAAL